MLLAVAFLPFPTRLVAEALDKDTDWQRLGAVVYGLTLLAIRLLFAGLGSYARQEHLRRPGADDPDFQGAHQKFRIALGGYVVTICLSLVVPKVAIVLYFAIAIFLIVPFRGSPERSLETTRNEKSSAAQGSVPSMTLVAGGAPDPSAKTLCDDARSSKATGLPGESTPHCGRKRFEQRFATPIRPRGGLLGPRRARRQLRQARSA